MSRLVVIAVLVAGCSNDRTAELEGTWTFAAGATDVAQCGTSVTTYDLTGFHFTLSAGTASALAMSSIAGGNTIDGWPPLGCTPGVIALGVDGGTASTASNTTCIYGTAVSGGTGYMATATFYPLTLELDAAGRTLTVNGSEHDVVTGNSGPCTPRKLTGTASR